jgi:hypothetical protein
MTVEEENKGKKECKYWVKTLPFMIFQKEGFCKQWYSRGLAGSAISYQLPDNQRHHRMLWACSGR